MSIFCKELTYIGIMHLFYHTFPIRIFFIYLQKRMTRVDIHDFQKYHHTVIKLSQIIGTSLKLIINTILAPSYNFSEIFWPFSVKEGPK